MQMNYSNFHIAMVRMRAGEIDRRARRLGPLLASVTEVSVARTPSEPLTVRLASPGDWPALRVLAELDSARTPAAPLLVGERAGRLVAALSLNDGAVIADPFQRSADVVALLELRARQLGHEQRRLSGRAIAWRLLRAGG